MLGVELTLCFGSVFLSINSGGFGNGHAIGSGYNIPLFPCLVELSGIFVTVASCTHVSIPVLVSRSIIVGSSSIIIGFISFLFEFPIDFTLLCVSGIFIFFVLL